MHRSSPLALIALVAACGGAAGPELDTAVAASTASNGSSLNGSSLNGSSLNGSSLNGSSLNGSSLNGVTLAGASMTGSLSGSQIVLSSKKATVSGTAVVGAVLQGQLSNGGTIPLRIDSAKPGTNANADVWYYGISYQTASGWLPLCGSASVPAVAVSGKWDASAAWTADSSTISFGCQGQGAIAKCVELGYKPWKTSSSGASLRSHHVACTRMIRADYCGDGVSHTVNGRAINVYDGAGVQADTGFLLWLFEAEWDTTGARCISALVNDRYVKAGLVPPSCFLGLVSLSCGATSHFSSGTLIMDETQAL